MVAYKKNGRAAAWIDFRQSNAFARASKVRGLHIRAASTMQSIDRLLMRLETRLRIAGDGHGRCAPLPLCARRSCSSPIAAADAESYIYHGTSALPAAPAPEEEKLRRFVVLLPHSTHRKFKQLAAAQETPMSDLCRAWVEEALASHFG